MSRSKTGIEDEAERIVKKYNEASLRVSEPLTWRDDLPGEIEGTSFLSPVDTRCYVFETEDYVDPKGLDAILETGRRVRYVEQIGTGVRVYVEVAADE
ncbi:MAG: hypothetical protein ABEJ94_06760 [Halorientalis sp.]